MQSCKTLRERIGLGVDDEVNAALPVEGHTFVTVAGDRRKAHGFEELSQCHRVRRGVLDELEPVGTHRVVPAGELHSNLLVALPTARILP